MNLTSGTLLWCHSPTGIFNSQLTVDWPPAFHSYPIYNEICQMNIEQFSCNFSLQMHQHFQLILLRFWQTPTSGQGLGAHCVRLTTRWRDYLSHLVWKHFRIPPSKAGRCSCLAYSTAYTNQGRMRSQKDCQALQRDSVSAHVCAWRNGLVARIKTQMPLQSSAVTNTETIAFSVNKMKLWKLHNSFWQLHNFHSFILTTSTE